MTPNKDKSMKPKVSDKLIAYVVEPGEDGWDMVLVTEFYKDKWMSGMVLLTSLEDVMEQAFKQKVLVIPISMMEIHETKSK